MKNEELLDVLDADANKTGQKLPKGELHKQELWHGGAHLWIYNSAGQVLLQHRHPGKEIFPNVWDISCAGHIDSGETPRQTLEREGKEELGLSIKAEELKCVGVTMYEDRLPQGWIHRVYDWTYILKMEIDPSKLELEDIEVDGVKWLDIDEFEADLNDPVRVKNYAPRPRYFYDLAITEMRKYAAGKL